MKVTVIPIVTGTLGTVTKGLVEGPEDLEIRRRVETIQNTTLLRSARILRVLENWWDLLSLRFLLETSANTDVKKKRVIYQWRFCEDRHQTLNYISVCSKLAQRVYKTRHNLVGEVFHKRLLKNVKFDHTTQRYIQKLESTR